MQTSGRRVRARERGRKVVSQLVLAIARHISSGKREGCHEGEGERPFRLAGGRAARRSHDGDRQPMLGPAAAAGAWCCSVGVLGAMRKAYSRHAAAHVGVYQWSDVVSTPLGMPSNPAAPPDVYLHEARLARSLPQLASPARPR